MGHGSLAPRRIDSNGSCSASSTSPDRSITGFTPGHQASVGEARHHTECHEGMTFEGLVERARLGYSAYVFAPLPIVGATGSPGNPTAVL
jgi:hypothetical protein